MSGPKRKSSGEFSDLSHHPTRKVDSMSTLVAEMLLRDPDADATSPGLPAVTADAAGRVAEASESQAHDAVGLDMARLIEVRSSVAPPSQSFARETAEDSANIRAMRSNAPRVFVWLVAILAFVAALAVAAVALSR